jgi:hypothetical protein
MDGSLHIPPRSQSLGTLFGEDFDVREIAPEPEVIEPVFSAADLESARESAWLDGHAKALQEAAIGDAAAIRQAVDAIASQIKADREAAVACANETAEAIARLLLDSLAAAFPALCANYGEAEVRAIIRIVLPPLTQEATITVRANPHTAAALAEEIGRLAPELIACVSITECDGMARGDVRITWHNGTAMRDARALWEQVAAVLAPAGLLQPDAMIKESADAC